MIEQLVTVIFFTIVLVCMQKQIKKWTLSKARYRIAVYEAVRSMIYVVELVLMVWL